MHSFADDSSCVEWSRRQFGTAVGGGVILLAAGGSYGVLSQSQHTGGTSVGTTFGTVSIIRAKRFSRLDAQGRIAASSPLTNASRSGGWGTDVSYRPKASAVGISAGHGHGDAPQGQAWPQPVNLTWGDVVVLEAEVHNAGRSAVLFSPAQLRLKLVPSGTTITPQDSDRVAGALAARTRERILISYLAPHSFTDLELEFSDVVRDDHLRLALPSLVAIRESL